MIPISVVIAAICFAAGVLVGVHFSARRRSPEKPVERKLALSRRDAEVEKMEAISRLAGGIAHDFNNLLTVISGQSRLLQEGGGDRLAPPGSPQGDRERVQQGLAEIEEAATRATLLTRQLLAVGRRQMLRPAVLDLNQLIRELVPKLRKLVGGNIVLELDLASELEAVRADPRRLEEALAHLMMNAHEAMPDGGFVTLKTAMRTEKVSSSLESPQGDKDPTGGDPAGTDPNGGAEPFVTLSVRDTGGGIDASVHPHIFEPFFTTKESHGSRGLGLPSVHGIVKQSGGHIRVVNRAPEGTSFILYFPPVENAMQVVAGMARESATAVRRGPQTILVVDDQADILVVVGAMLESTSYRVLKAKGGAEALEVLAQRADEVDLLLTDVLMPEMSGPELADEVRKLYPHILLLFMSGFSPGWANEHGVPADARLVEKPFTHESLQQRIDQMFDDCEVLEGLTVEREAARR